jgi:hypothetical protein
MQSVSDLHEWRCASQWRADGRELFYLTLDGQLVAGPMAQVDGDDRCGPARLCRCL